MPSVERIVKTPEKTPEKHSKLSKSTTCRMIYLTMLNKYHSSRKFDKLKEHEGPKGSVIEGLITITYSARESPDYPDVIINMTPAREVHF